MQINNKEVSDEMMQNWLVHKGTGSQFAPGAYGKFLNQLNYSLKDLIVPGKKESKYLYVEYEQHVKADVWEHDDEPTRARWWLVPVYTKNKNSLFLVSTLLKNVAKIPDDSRIGITKIEKLEDLENIKVVRTSLQNNSWGFDVNEVIIAALIKTAREELDLEAFFAKSGKAFLDDKNTNLLKKMKI